MTEFSTREGHEIEVGKHYQARNGRIFEYLRNDGAENYPLDFKEVGYNFVISTTSEGCYLVSGRDNEYDIMRPVKIEVKDGLKIEGVEPEAPKCVNGDPIIRDEFYTFNDNTKVKVCAVISAETVVIIYWTPEGTGAINTAIANLLSKWVEPTPAEPKAPVVPDTVDLHVIVYKHKKSRDGSLLQSMFSSREMAELAYKKFLKGDKAERYTVIAILPVYDLALTIGYGIPTDGDK